MPKKHLTILVPNGDNNISSIAGTYKIFMRANKLRTDAGKEELFKVELAGSSKTVDYHGGLFSVHPNRDIREIRRTDLIIIPSLNHNFEDSIVKNRTMIEWLKQQHRSGAEIASICTGAFMLASSGILTNKKCSVHWAAADAFRKMYPEVNLQPDELITDENGIYTNGGAYSFLNLIIYLVEKYYDRKTAIYCSKVFQIDYERNSQSPFSMFTGEKSHGDEMVVKAQSYIERHAEERVSVEELSSRFSVGRRHFDRRFIKATGKTPVEYIQRVRIESAKKAFENTNKTVNEVMYDVGYSDPKAFREVFRKITGMSPLEYKERYNKRSVKV